MSAKKPYEVKRKEYRLDKNDDQKMEIIFSIKGPTVCVNKFTKEEEADVFCDMLNEVYTKGHQDGAKHTIAQSTES